ncbi:MAG: cysteine desulfurase [Emcibacter sp.]|nr:cysteine desulfurase [Emcibacter sp.]
MIYLDHNATTPIKPEVIEEMVRVMKIGGNPSSVHGVGRRAKTVLEQSRQTIAKIINCRPQKIIFTSGGTEANNIAAKITGLDHIIISAIEHDSILRLRDNFTGTIDILPVDSMGYVSADDLKERLKNSGPHTLVSIMLANNETGVIQDIKNLADITHDAGAYFHCDAIQALGKISLDFRALGVDMLSLSAHKIGGPQGVGALVALEKINIDPIILGGGQEVGRRSGTENIAGIAGFAKAVSLVPDQRQKMDSLRQLRDYMEREIAAYARDAVFYGAQSQRLPNTSTILMPHVTSEIQVMAFDLEGICVSSGSACSSGKVKPSHVVAAMGGGVEQALSTIRVSLGFETTKEDVEAFIVAWKKIYSRKKKTI